MSARHLLAAAVLLLLLSTLPARAQSQVVSPAIPLGLGFGPADLAPVSQGIPVYTSGDQLWAIVYSQSPALLELLAPSGSVASGAYVSPMSATLLYTFGADAAPGQWTLDLVPSGVNSTRQTVPILLVAPGAVQPTLTSFGVSSGGSLSMNFTLGSGEAYDVSACAASAANPKTVELPLPAGLGSGEIFLSGNKSEVSISPNFKATAPFSFWLELHQNFSYGFQGSPALVSQDLTEARTGEMAFGGETGNGSTTAAFSDLAQVRAGYSTLWAYFRSQTGVTVVTSPVLVPDNSTWIPLGVCSAFVQVQGPTFALTTSLKAPASEWPSTLYTMYSEDGVEGFTNETLGVLPASADLVSSSSGRGLTDSLASVARSPGVLSSALSGNTVYLAAIAFPVTLNVSLLPGVFDQWQLRSPFKEYTLQVPSGTASVTALSGGARASGASVTITYRNQTVAEGSGATSEFYLPEGNYTAAVTVGGATKSLSFALEAGGFANETMAFQQAAPKGFPYPLLAVALAGAAVSAAVWADVYRKRRSWRPNSLRQLSILDVTKSLTWHSRAFPSVESSRALQGTAAHPDAPGHSEGGT